VLILIELSHTSVQNNGVDLAKFPIILGGGGNICSKKF
jgi:hypothetical protein